jgi:hypothetical protein
VPEDTNAHLIDALNSLTHLQEILTDLQGEIQQSTLRAEASLNKNISTLSLEQTNGGEDVS